MSQKLEDADDLYQLFKDPEKLKGINVERCFIKRLILLVWTINMVTNRIYAKEKILYQCKIFIYNEK